MTQRIESRNGTGDDFRSLRKGLGMSQAAVAARFGFSDKTISRWERGRGKPRPVVMERLRSLAYPHLGSSRDGGRFTFIDLFAGIGGLRRGFESVGGECVYTSEWDKYAQMTYRENYVCKDEIAGDITQVSADEIPAHDVLLAGFPCQPFSIAGVSKKNALGRPHGFACDTQGTLFFDVARILEHHRPRAFLLENVRNLVSHDSGRTFSTIRQVLENELGYHITWRVIDARHFVPQHRERIFIVGFRDHAAFSWDDLELPDLESAPRLRTILHSEDGSEEPEDRYTNADGTVALKYHLSDHLWTYLRNYAAKHQMKGNGFGYGLFGPDDTARTLSARYHKDGSEILIRTSAGVPRRLTPRECARLMGYDRPGEAAFRIPVSDTQAYRQFGNSVVVPVVEAVARAMSPFIENERVTWETQLRLPLYAAAG